MSRVVVITLSSLLLVGMVAAVTFGMVFNWGKSGADSRKIGSSTKAVQAMCQPTDYKEACFKSMSSVKTDDPKELVKAAFESAKAEISNVAQRSPVLKELEKDPKTAEAVKDCKELFQTAIDDLQRSFDEIGEFEWGKVDQAMGNLKSWLSATITYQETCLDGFDNTTGDASERVRKILQTSKQMTSNGLAIVNDMSSIVGSLDLSFNRRRLLTSDDEERVEGHDEDDVVPWMGNRRLLSSTDDNAAGNDDDDGETLLGDNEADKRRRRKLLSSDEDKVEGHDDDDDLPSWLAGSGRRKLLMATNLAEDLKAKANVVVAKDGTGMYHSIEEAIKVIPMNNKQTFIIYVKEGVYHEYLVIPKWNPNVVLIGDGPTKTRITNNKNFVDGTKTFKTATLTVLADFFMAKDIGVENSAGPEKHQAVALRVQSDQSIFFNCHFDGYQDTLYTHTYRQFYRDCQISGTIDFVFGDAAAFFQNCTFVVRKPLKNQRCIVTAQGRMDRHQPTGIFIHRSRVVADPEYYPLRFTNTAYLGRPWKAYSKTIYMESHLDDLIDPSGWLEWDGDFGLHTCYYGEYNDVGPGASLEHRVKWRGIKTIIHRRAETFMPRVLYDTDVWIRDSGIPYDPTLYALAPGTSEPLGNDEDPDAPSALPHAGRRKENKKRSKGGSRHAKDDGKKSQGTSKQDSGKSNGQAASSADAPIIANRQVVSPAPSTIASAQAPPTFTSSSPSPSPSLSPSATPTRSPSSSTKEEEKKQSKKGIVHELERLLMSNEEVLDSEDDDDIGLSLKPNTHIVDSAQAPTTNDGPSPSPSPNSSPSPSQGPSTEEVEHTTEVATIHDLERFLMTEDDTPEDEQAQGSDDMSGNVPDGDEPSPAVVQPPSPSPSPSDVTLDQQPSPSPSPSPSEEVSDWIPPATAPGPDTELEPADKVVPPTADAAHNAAESKLKYEFPIVLSGMVMWAALAA